MLKRIYLFIKNYALNGLNAYALFGFYALTISPFITRFIDYHEQSFFVFIFGFTMLILEFHALNFKLKVVRLRADERSRELKRKTGIERIPTVGKAVLFAFFLRMTFRLGIIMISMTALGYPCLDRDMSPVGATVLVVGFFIDSYGLIYIFLKTTFYNDIAESEEAFKEKEEQRKRWNQINLPLAHSVSYYWKEVISDLVLQVYALMLYTAFWKYINETAVGMLYVCQHDKMNAFEAAMEIFPMMIILVSLGLMPIRIAYWIEDSMMAFTIKEKISMWIIYFLVVIFTCVPAIFIYLTMFIYNTTYIKLPFPVEYLNLVLSLLLFFILFILQLILYGTSGKKETTRS